MGHWESRNKTTKKLAPASLLHLAGRSTGWNCAASIGAKDSDERTDHGGCAVLR